MKISDPPSVADELHHFAERILDGDVDIEQCSLVHDADRHTITVTVRDAKLAEVIPLPARSPSPDDGRRPDRG